MGLSVSISNPHGGQHKTKTRTRPMSVQVDSLDTSMEDTLGHFIYRDPVRHTMPMFSRWSPIGRGWRHGASDIEALVIEFERALVSAEPGSHTARLFEKLLSMARRALAEDLVMDVNPD